MANTVRSEPPPRPPSAVAPPPKDIDLFRFIDDDGRGWILPEQIWRALERTGLDPKGDPRLRHTRRALDAMPATQRIDPQTFSDLIGPAITLVERALRGQLIVPEFGAFGDDVREIFGRVEGIREGAVADYIPQLARVDPEQFALSICTVDGQRLSLGDHDVDFCVQSCCKPINYCIALEENGEELVHRHIGREPSGQRFNELTLNEAGRPHNPMINAGAIMSCSLVAREQHMSERFDHVMGFWRRLSGGAKAGFNNSVYLSERSSADRNFALGYFMQERNVFPANTELVETLEFYFQCCSIEMTADRMSVVASTLAHGGICPLTGERVFSPATVRNCLSLMYSCGMYDYSGEFAFRVGLPAKSGVAGALLVVVPNVMGLCVWSPRLDRLGNSVRGIAMCKELVRIFNFHNYDNLSGLGDKKDPRGRAQMADAQKIFALIWAAGRGDLDGVRQMLAQGVDVNGADYDRRTALHLAAAEGRGPIVRFLLQRGAQLDAQDRWGATPSDDAQRHGHDSVLAMLRESGAADGPIN